MSLSALQPINLDIPTPVSAYLKKMTPFCPFIEPAARAGCLHGCVVTPDCITAEDIDPRVFEQLVPLIERFRDARRALPDKNQRLLICHTVVVHMTPHLDAETARRLVWPNWVVWALRQLYTPKELVFGIVRKGAAESSLAGSPLPVSPFHAVIIRSRVVRSDHRFFPNNEPLLQAMMEADDDGEDVHAAAFGKVPDIRDPEAIREMQYFQRVREWAEKIVRQQANNAGKGPPIG
jgi:hypothetical protein